jgi:hypothetical protein
MDTNNMNLCYARLAHITGLNYNAIEMKSSVQHISETLGSWNSKHPGVIPIPIGLNEDSHLVPMAQAKLVEPKIEKILIN